jgi:type IV secretory pathway VirB10-like protein
MLSNQEIIYIVYYVVERILSLLIMGSYGAATFGVLLGFIINLGIIHLLIKYNFKQLANIVLVVGILFSIISQILCFKNLTSCNFREGMEQKNKKDDNIIKNPSPSPRPRPSPPPSPAPPPSPPPPPRPPQSQNRQNANRQRRRMRKIMSLQNRLENDNNRRRNKNSNWTAYSNQLSGDSLYSPISYNN